MHGGEGRVFRRAVTPDEILLVVRDIRARLTRLERGTVPRYDRAARRLHWAVLTTFSVLVYTGLAAYFPWLATPVGGTKAALVLHRSAGVVMAASAVAFVAAFPRRAARFLGGLARWRLKDLVWLAGFPLYIVSPSRCKLPRVEDKLNPGQKVVGGLLILLAAVQAATGLARWPTPGLPAGIVERAEAVHQVVFPVILLLFLGHAFVGSGVHPEYRGVWRSGLGDGRIPVRLARKHWPQWLAEKARGAEHPGKPAGALAKGVLVALGMGAFVLAVPLLIPGPRPWRGVTDLPRVDSLPEGVFETRVGPFAYKIWIKARGAVQVQIADGPGVPVPAWQSKRALIQGALIERRYRPEPRREP